MWRVVVALALTLTVMLVGVLTPAWGESWEKRDPRSDGFAGGEITRFQASNRNQAVIARAKFKDLKRGRISGSYLVIDTRRNDGNDYMLFSSWTGTKVRRNLIRVVPFSDADAHRIRCPGMEVHWRTSTDRMTFSIPQRCLARPSDHVRLGIYVYEHRGGFDWAPAGFARYGPWLSMG